MNIGCTATLSNLVCYLVPSYCEFNVCKYLKKILQKTTMHKCIGSEFMDTQVKSRRFISERVDTRAKQKKNGEDIDTAIVNKQAEKDEEYCS